jgi:hypothetical protein
VTVLAKALSTIVSSEGAACADEPNPNAKSATTKMTMPMTYFQRVEICGI